MREFALLQHVFRSSADMPAGVAIGPGDDMALVRLAGRNLLAAVDQVVDGRHIRLENTPLKLAGRKAIARSVSDIAAMAGRPVASLVAVVLPVGFGEARARELFDAMRMAAAEMKSPLIGGDIAMHDREGAPLVCSVTVLAEPTSPRGAVTRDGARRGDTLYVTGEIGGAFTDNGLGHHLIFTPRTDEGIALAAQLGDRLHAMIDLSDGLGRDASHIAHRSGVAIEIDASALPCREGSDWRGAMGGGEDYELCFAATGGVPATILGTRITPVGRVVEPSQERGSSGGTLVTVNAEGKRFGADEMGWEHAGT